MKTALKDRFLDTIIVSLKNGPIDIPFYESEIQELLPLEFLSSVEPCDNRKLLKAEFINEIRPGAPERANVPSVERPQ